MTGTTAFLRPGAALLMVALAGCDAGLSLLEATGAPAILAATPPETVSAFADDVPPPETEPAFGDPPEREPALPPEPAPEPAPDPEALARAQAEAERAAFEAAYPLHGVTFHFLARVRTEPKASAKVAGYFRRGATFRASERVPGVGCPRGWHEVPGEGFVCRGEGFLVGRDPQSFEPAPAPPKAEDPLPYGYAWAPRDGVAQFWRVPTPAEEAEIDALLARRFAPEPEPEPEPVVAPRNAAEAPASEEVTGESPSTETRAETGSPRVESDSPEAAADDAPEAPGSPDDASGSPATVAEPPPGSAPAPEGPATALEGAADAGGGTAEAPEAVAVSADVQAPPPPGSVASADDTGADDPGAGAVPETPTEPELPAIVRMPMRRGFTVSLDGEVTEGGRRFFRTVRGGYVRADRLNPSAPSDHRGVVLGGSWELPVGFVWRGGTRRLRRRGHRFANAGMLERLSPIDVAETVRRGARAYVVDLEGFAANRRSVRVAEPIARPEGVGSAERWLHVSLSEQTVVAYEGDRPVFATSVSTGREGFETPTGTFRIQSKHVSTTMDDLQSDEPYQIEDVPWTMYFEGNYALHGAFWHAGFGRVRSHGCVNLAPADARWLFRWAGPEVPPGWHGVFASRARPGSAVHVTE